MDKQINIINNQEVAHHLPSSKQKLEHKDPEKPIIAFPDFTENKNFTFVQTMLRIKMKKFAKKIIYQTTSKMFQLLNGYHYLLLNDYQQESLGLEAPVLEMIEPYGEPNIGATQFFTDSAKRKNQFLQFVSGKVKKIKCIYRIYLWCCNMLYQNIPVFMPSSIYKLIWDGSTALDTLALLFYIPLHIAFGTQFIITELIYYFLLKWVLDMITQLNTGFYEKGELVHSRWKILQNFFRHNLFSDCCSVISVVYLYVNQEHASDQVEEHQEFLNPYQLFLLFFFFKLNHFNKISKKIEERFLLSPKLRNKLQLLKLFLTIVIIAHLLASIWIFIAHFELIYYSSQLTSWIKALQIDDRAWMVQYIHAYYYTIVTMVTVGYGDISPKNPLEMVVSIFTIIFGCGVFAYSLNLVGSIFQEIFKFQNQMKNNLYIINNYMAKKQVNEDLQFQVRKYLVYFWKQSAIQNQSEEDKIIRQLTSSLQDQLLFEANKMVLQDSPIFANNFSDVLLHKTVPLIKEYRGTPEEVLYINGELDEQCIYFIEKGEVELYFEVAGYRKLDCQRMVVKQLQKGNSFGQYSFFTGNARTQCARCINFCTLLVIKRTDFLELLKNYAYDFERFCHIKDNITLNGDFDLIRSRCFSCKSTKHDLNQCPLVHYVPNVQRILKIHCKNVMQDRNNYFKRKHKTKLNTLLNTPFFLVMVKAFKKNEEDLLRTYVADLKLLRDGYKQQVNAHSIFFTSSIAFDLDDDEDDDDYDDENENDDNEAGGNNSQDKISIGKNLEDSETSSSRLSNNNMQSQIVNKNGSNQHQNRSEVSSVQDSIRELPSLNSDIVLQSQQQQQSCLEVIDKEITQSVSQELEKEFQQQLQQISITMSKQQIQSDKSIKESANKGTLSRERSISDLGFDGKHQQQLLPAGKKQKKFSQKQTKGQYNGSEIGEDDIFEQEKSVMNTRFLQDGKGANDNGQAATNNNINSAQQQKRNPKKKKAKTFLELSSGACHQTKEFTGDATNAVRKSIAKQTIIIKPEFTLEKQMTKSAQKSRSQGNLPAIVAAQLMSQIQQQSLQQNLHQKQVNSYTSNTKSQSRIDICNGSQTFIKSPNRETIFFQKKPNITTQENQFQNQLNNYQQQQFELAQFLCEFELQQQFETLCNFAVYKPWNNLDFILTTKKMSKQQVMKERDKAMMLCAKKLGQKKNYHVSKINDVFQEEQTEQQNPKEKERISLMRNYEPSKNQIMIKKSKKSEQIKLSVVNQLQVAKNQLQNTLNTGTNIVTKNANNDLSEQRQLQVITIQDISINQIPNNANDSLIQEETANNSIIPITLQGKFIKNKAQLAIQKRSEKEQSLPPPAYINMLTDTSQAKNLPNVDQGTQLMQYKIPVGSGQEHNHNIFSSQQVDLKKF